ncbi:MAG: hypothetical protein HQL69_23805 [Magnetococcales bacterium]|nr:hypothetical protein [Magnetococcales bacterium]
MPSRSAPWSSGGIAWVCIGVGFWKPMLRNVVCKEGIRGKAEKSDTNILMFY